MAILLTALAAASLSSCGNPASRAALLWSDAPELAAYVELFNAENGRYRVEAQYRKRPLQGLSGNKAPPDIIVGRWINGPASRPAFRSVDHLFSELRLNARDFYPDLLGQGKFEGRQLLIPLSFNLPSAVFDAGAGDNLEAGFFLTLASMEESGKAFNVSKGDVFTRMGFSPRWDPEFLYLLSRLNGASFQQGKPLSYDIDGLARAVQKAREWVSTANASPAAEDEFSFKYLYDPGYRSVSAGRILLSYMSSDGYFNLPEQKRAGLSFRWIAQDGKVPFNDDVVFLALTRAGRNRQAADAFVSWIFSPATQGRILEDSRSTRVSEMSFGLAGGFSSLKDVNEKVFPSYYPDLVGHMPPEGPFLASKPLPPDWDALKREVVLPFLQSECAKPFGSAPPAKADLEERLAAWQRENPDS
jgi:ABC-type glycerol-3-phosphate transport system substrate-binding protein